MKNTLAYHLDAELVKTKFYKIGGMEEIRLITPILPFLPKRGKKNS
jgi:hypothetical protein